MQPKSKEYWLAVATYGAPPPDRKSMTCEGDTGNDPFWGNGPCGTWRDWGDGRCAAGHTIIFLEN